MSKIFFPDALFSLYKASKKIPLQLTSLHRYKMFKSFELSILLIIFVVITSSVVSTPILNIRDTDPNQQSATLVNNSIYCSFLPPDYGGNISGSEDDAVAFCNQVPEGLNVRILPDNFIKSYHFATGDGYIQVTGTINRDAYGLSANDEGGQYDAKAPRGAKCVGYKNFVNLVEPDAELFCIRCCTDTSQCDTGHSTDGCKKVIPGDYS
ncbi:6110_t:CDS:1 [Acaulospora morrowiae]|uniref:6110_t:CDS:1 n=1 Tax=Acaulospora morrowiae TaxID=94023 RepID=A0A9N9H338_9GLOM|nr:6110_t:CDS:1 [Acaulospora morrowiae]